MICLAINFIVDLTFKWWNNTANKRALVALFTGTSASINRFSFGRRDSQRSLMGFNGMNAVFDCC